MGMSKVVFIGQVFDELKVVSYSTSIINQITHIEMDGEEIAQEQCEVLNELLIS